VTAWNYLVSPMAFWGVRAEEQDRHAYQGYVWEQIQFKNACIAQQKAPHDDALESNTRLLGVRRNYAPMQAVLVLNPEHRLQYPGCPCLTHYSVQMTEVVAQSLINPFGCSSGTSISHPLGSSQMLTPLVDQYFGKLFSCMPDPGSASQCWPAMAP
jgi:hypothetical protein